MKYKRSKRKLYLEVIPLLVATLSLSSFKIMMMYHQFHYKLRCLFRMDFVIMQLATKVTFPVEKKHATDVKHRSTFSIPKFTKTLRYNSYYVKRKT